MGRLTKYKPTPNSMFPYKLIDDGANTELDAIHKLGKLEDIEEELGCSIEVVFKALKDGIYQKELYFPNVKNHLDAKYLRLNTWYNQLEWTDIWNGCNVYEFELKDYKKTWWLKEDKPE